MVTGGPTLAVPSSSLTPRAPCPFDPRHGARSAFQESCDRTGTGHGQLTVIDGIPECASPQPLPSRGPLSRGELDQASNTGVCGIKQAKQNDPEKRTEEGVGRAPADQGGLHREAAARRATFDILTQKCLPVEAFPGHLP